MGISRSATVVCAYLVATTTMRSQEAIDFVISKRAIVCPNIGFRRQLETYSVRFSTNKGFVARSKSRINGVGQGVAAQVRKLKRLGSIDSLRARTQVQTDTDTKDTKDPATSMTVTVSSVRIDPSIAEDVASLPVVEK